ncbi:glycosyltransferase [Halanaerobium kushneri]|uniref:Glycosyltransferase involved in cell wall bisynthesis n=1 Tax=Halanaerobium kushneri TaxID=56779 RepID=A0A1N6RQ56_9FIRM|nr:glycosyltransferase [Halanaerobium kushneri]SIQ31004.1 Glycosyltransferase involved in cell wall bisynthesis [Halanaerobium kushneri]
MNIMVFDVPAESGGALSILNDFYQEVIENDDKNINWIFVLSKPEYKEFDNITVLNFSWVKKSWFHRLYFDHFVAPKLVKKYNIDKIFSLQNVIIPKTDVEQILYAHQPLPFSGYKFNINENFKFWIYQNLISKKIYNSIKLANKVIVQTNWMKKACTEKADVKSDKIDVIPPKINLNIENTFDKNNKIKTFFYPAGASYYKNHRLIIEASKLLEASNINDYKIILTLNGNENKNIKELYKEVKKYNLPVEFAGRLERDEVFNLYTKSYLLFPSYIETFGLPMLEAKLHKTIILASDKAFSHEILDDYENAYFFDPFDAEELMKYMKKLLVGEISYKKVNSVSKSNNNSLYSEVIKKLN